MGRNQPEADGFDIAERLQEMEPTLSRRGLHSLIGVFGLSLVTSPWMGWAGSLVAGAVLAYWILSMGPLRRLLPIRDRMLLNLLVVNLGLAVSLATSGGPRSPVLPIVAAVPVAVVIMFPRQPLLVYGAPVVATLAGTLVIHPQETIEDPAPTLITLAAAILVPFLVLEGIDLELAHRKRALVDSLTGCLNRHALDQRVAELEAQCRLTGARIGVVAFDVDHFKRINDEAGHAVGDQVLQELGYACRKELGNFELLYRIGGEEFLVVLPDGGPEVCVEVAERLRCRVASLHPGGHRVTISCGTASRSGADVEVAELMAAADAALYRAKAEGRNRTVAATAGPAGPDRRRRAERRRAADHPV